MEAIAKNNLDYGRVLIWLGGNEVCGRPKEDPSGINVKDVEEVMWRLRNRLVVLAGPTPRLWHDADAQYEETPAFRADLTLRREAETHGARFIPYVGRALTSMSRRRHVVRGDIACHWFNRDGTHLSPLGYQKVQRKIDSFVV